MPESQNVQLLRRILDAFNRGDLDAVAEPIGQDFELVRIEGGPDSVGTLKGQDAFRQFLEPETFDSMRIELLGFHELDDLILVETITYVTGSGSGIEIDQPGFQVWTFSDGRPTRLKLYLDRNSAFAEAGIDPG